MFARAVTGRTDSFTALLCVSFVLGTCSCVSTLLNVQLPRIADPGQEPTIAGGHARTRRTTPGRAREESDRFGTKRRACGPGVARAGGLTYDSSRAFDPGFRLRDPGRQAPCTAAGEPPGLDLPQHPIMHLPQKLCPSFSKPDNAGRKLRDGLARPMRSLHGT